MTEPNTDPTKAYFCPQCGAATIDHNLLARSASCNACGWSGTSSDLATLPFQHQLGPSVEEMLRTFFVDIRGMLGEKFALEFGKLLIRWGFLPAADPKKLARYLAAAARGIVSAVLQERAEQEKEAHGSAAQTPG